MKRFILVLLIYLCAPSAWAGWVLTYADAESGEQTQELYERGKANLGEMIYNGKHFLVVDQESVSYWKGTPEQYCKAMRTQQQTMEAQMASMPPQYRPVPMSTKKVTRKKIGTQSIAGYSATGYEFYVDGSQASQVWVSSDSDFSDIIDFEKSMLEKVKCLDDIDSSSLESTDIYTKTVEGTVILKESYRELESAEKKRIAASLFEAPSGYKAFTDFQLFMGHIIKQSRSSSGSSSFDMETSQPQWESQYEQDDQGEHQAREDNVIVKDAKEITGDVADEAHESTKRGVKDELSKDVKKGVKSLLDSFF